VIKPLTILLWALAVGATSAGITVAVRALPFVYRWVEEQKKPWGCDICMSFWIVGLLGLGLGHWQGWEYVLVCGPAYPWAMWVLCKVSEPKGPPPFSLEDSDAP